MGTREDLSFKYIGGRGIEIGALHCPLAVREGTIVDYVDREQYDEHRKEHLDVTPIPVKVIVAEAETLEPIEYESQDFIIANHVIEHVKDVLGTLAVWRARLKPNGIIYMAIPEKTQTFDRDRQVTTLQHFRDDLTLGSQYGDREHYREWFSVVDKLSGEKLEAKIEQALANNSNIHFHVFDNNLIGQLSVYLSQLFETLEIRSNGAETIMILKKKESK